MNHGSFWSESLLRSEELNSSQLPDSVDVAIVGGGYTGLNAARILAQHGAAVVVLEQREVGWGASSRNGGMLTPGLKVPLKTVFKRYGEVMGRRFWQASVDAVNLVEEIVQEENIDCDFSRSGHVALAYKSTHFQNMRKNAVWYQKKLGYGLQIIGPDELYREIGSQAYHGGIVDSSSAGLNPAKYVWGLGLSAVRAGGKICEYTTVNRIDREQGGFLIYTEQGVLKTKQVLIATNGYTGQLVKGLNSRIFPVGSYIIVTDPLLRELRDEISPNKRMYFDSKNFLNYFRLTPDGRMLFGGRNDLSTDPDHVESANQLRRRMIEVFPQLKDAPITHSWSGNLGLTFDLMPHIGLINGIHYALGYGGHGVSTATYVGREIGLILAGVKNESPFMSIPHPRRFFYRGNPWFTPLAAQYYRLLDRLT